jgi:ADP-heptose:LPS heptosyltransferase
MPDLHIYDPRERALVAAADHVLRAAAHAARPFRRRAGPGSPRRILLLRLERIGDLIMALPAIADVRALAPDATIDLAVGSWNAALARAVPAVDAVEPLDAAWLAREGPGRPLRSLLRAAAAWRRRRYDLAINFEPDIRSNLIAAASGASWTAGFGSGGGGPLLDLALDYDPRAHTTANTRRLVAAAFGRTPPPSAAPVLCLPEGARREAEARLGPRPGPLIGVHPSGGRAIKQWEPARFAAVARRLVEERGADIVLTGAAADRGLVDAVRAALPADRTIDASGEADVLTLGAILERLDLFITGDTGPMHLATCVGTPVVAVFGPSDPRRYAPLGPRDRVVRIDLACAPCNRIRLPPGRCVGHTPDCLAGVDADRVFDAAVAVLEGA